MPELPARSIADVRLSEVFDRGGCPLCTQMARSAATYMNSFLYEGVTDVGFRRELDRARGSTTPDAVLQQEIEARDRADQEREVAPLRAASDAIIVATEGKSVHQVFDEVMARLPKH